MAVELIERGASVEEANPLLVDKLIATSDESIVNTLGEKQSEHQLLVQGLKGA